MGEEMLARASALGLDAAYDGLAVHVEVRRHESA
jgi:hypothetical protein